MEHEIIRFIWIIAILGGLALIATWYDIEKGGDN